VSTPPKSQITASIIKIPIHANAILSAANTGGSLGPALGELRLAS